MFYFTFDKRSCKNWGLHVRRLGVCGYGYIHGKAVDMDKDGKFYIHGKPGCYPVVHRLGIEPWNFRSRI